MRTSSVVSGMMEAESLFLRSLGGKGGSAPPHLLLNPCLPLPAPPLPPLQGLGLPWAQLAHPEQAGDNHYDQGDHPKGQVIITRIKC